VCMQVLTTAPLPTRFRSALVCMQVLTTAPFPPVSESGAVCSVPQVWVLSLSTHAVILNRHVAIHSLGECSYAVWMSGSLVPVAMFSVVRTRAVRGARVRKNETVRKSHQHEKKSALIFSVLCHCACYL
jgi:cytochrome bd-type quinol oxidase subunit 2